MTRPAAISPDASLAFLRALRGGNRFLADIARASDLRIDRAAEVLDRGLKAKRLALVENGNVIVEVRAAPASAAGPSTTIN